MPEVVRIGGVELRFLHSKEETGGSLDMFEMTLRPNARMPVPHHHESWDETVYGLAGTSTWRIGGREVEVAPGGTALIRRGIVHGFENPGGGASPPIESRLLRRLAGRRRLQLPHRPTLRPASDTSASGSSPPMPSSPP